MAQPTLPHPYASGNRYWRGPVLLAMILVVHALLWTVAVRTSGGFVPARQIAAEFLSTLAVICISSNLMLSTRPRPVERWLQGLDKMFGVHRLIGISVALFVAAHFLIVPKSPGLVPSKPFGYTNLVLVLTVVFLASAPRMPWRRIVTLKYQNWKASHRLNGVLLLIAIVHSRLAPTYVRSVPLLVAYVYGIATLGLAAWLYRELAFRQFGPLASWPVSSARHLDGVTEVTLEAASSTLARRPGQFAFATFEAGPSREDHPFTVSSPVESALRLSIKASGDFTRELASDALEGSRVRIEGPYGAFNHARGLRRQLWLAGGIGITPFLSMAAAVDDSYEVELVWSVHDRAEAVYAAELEERARAHPALKVIVHPTSELGHVDIESLGTLAAGRDCSVFLCGPLPMRMQALRELARLGIPKREIYFEEFRLR